MRIRTFSVPGLAVATVLGVGGVALGTSTAEAGVTPVKGVGVQLPVQDFRAIELDEDRGRLSTWPKASALVCRWSSPISTAGCRPASRPSLTSATWCSATTGARCSSRRASTGSPPRRPTR
jgi:hypothetical protein